MKKTPYTLGAIALFAGASSLSAQLVNIDFSDSNGTDAAAAVDQAGRVTNTQSSVGWQVQSGSGVFAYDAASNVGTDPGTWTQFKVREFTDVTDTAFSSVTLTYQMNFDLSNNATRGTKFRVGLQYDDGTDTVRVSDQGILHVTDAQARPDSYETNNLNTGGDYATLNPTNNWGLAATGANSVTMTTVIDFVADTVTYSYANPNDGDGGTVVYASYAYTGSAVNELRFALDAENNASAYAFGDGTGGEYYAINSVTLTGVAVPEPSTFALLGGLCALGYVMVRRRRA
ncbi:MULTISPECIES: PEP-CTERM sorting domain-containing protein [unclassified Lentimonas]|uniref:PEP-CTERM sorting domain-containing protein n=1 Tax=unclassified Lentimonas TaxID=2630993 RepID=UPI001322D8AF|nr:MULTISPECIES: PEP-CTERM sorting domain-containing protein [unclassified Lentimonas]CAA6676650.1 Unannotated [Lentimonas sp. CC4]CAA6684687.1 Unannotated [Lentimonas sp. CC6]CAA7075322.1 Unannotated [Lentimonas sp. CC4]CAA7170989.1 Unannotated [Lentimonas sp. CC21]CAA7182270.1 Unannotated [Lentimonas sp. CC8]